MNRLLLICLPIILVHSSFYPERKPKLKLPREFACIPAGTLVMPAESAAGHYLYDSVAKIPMTSYYMSKYEVSNRQYREFVSAVSTNETGWDLSVIIPDTSAWQQAVSFNEPLVKHYFRHPSFDKYPVVNVSYEGAIKYCEWLQRKLQADNLDFEIEVRIPSKAEWVFAAQGGRSQAMFPWGNYYLRNKKGEPMCKFNVVDDGRIYRDRNTGKPAVSIAPVGSKKVFTSSVESYYPNDYGLYNMCGNAAEMVAEKGVCMGGSWDDYGADVHILANHRYQSPAPTVGFRPVIIVSEKN